MRWLSVVLVLLWAVLPVGAQSEGTVIDLGDYEVTLPEGWELPDFDPFYVMADEFAAVHIAHQDNGLEGLLVSPAVLAELLPNFGELDAQEALTALIGMAYQVDPEEVTEFYPADVGYADGIRWNYRDEESDEEGVISGDVYLLPLEGGGYLLADIYTYEAYFDENQDGLLASLAELFIGLGVAQLDMLLPLAGDWAFVIDPEAALTCGDRTETVNAAEIVTELSQTLVLEEDSDTSFVLDGQVFAFEGDGVFVSSLGDDGSVSLYVESYRVMSGEMVVALDEGCSARLFLEGGFLE